MKNYVRDSCITWLQTAINFLNGIGVKTDTDYHEKVASVALIASVIEILKKEDHANSNRVD